MSQHILFFFISNLIHCFSRLHTTSVVLFPLHVSGLTGPSSGGPNCTRSLWYSPPENGIVYHHYIKIVYQVGNKEK